MRAVRFISRFEWPFDLRKSAKVILFGVLLSLVETGSSTYTVERSPDSDLSRIVSPSGQVVSTGRWLSTGPEGPWNFYESNGNRGATITLSQGVPNGPLRFYWGSRVVPSAAGRLQVAGTVRDGKFEQRWLRYAANGAVINETLYQNDELISTRSYLPNGMELPPGAAMARARQLDNVDRQLLRLLLAVTHHAKAVE
jgi:hypothetical protein